MHQSHKSPNDLVKSMNIFFDKYIASLSIHLPDKSFYPQGGKEYPFRDREFSFVDIYLKEGLKPAMDFYFADPYRIPNLFMDRQLVISNVVYSMMLSRIKDVDRDLVHYCNLKLSDLPDGYLMGVHKFACSDHPPKIIIGKDDKERCAYESVAYLIHTVISRIEGLKRIMEWNQENSLKVAKGHEISKSQKGKGRLLPSRTLEHIIYFPMKNIEEIKNLELEFIEHPDNLSDDETGKSVLVRIRNPSNGKVAFRNFSSMGFRAGNKDEPVQAWSFLCVMGKHDGVLIKNDLPQDLRSKEFKAVIFEMRIRMRHFFMLEDLTEDSASIIPFNKSDNKFHCGFNCSYTCDDKFYEDSHKALNEDDDQ